MQKPFRVFKININTLNCVGRRTVAASGDRKGSWTGIKTQNIPLNTAIALLIMYTILHRSSFFHIDFHKKIKGD